MPSWPQRRSRLHAATDPSTPPRKLATLLAAELARPAPDRTVLRALAGHPNLSPKTWRELLLLCPNDAADNPSLPALLRDQPDLLKEAFSHSLLHLLRQEHLSPELLAALQEHPDPAVAEAAGLHVAVSGDTPAPEARSPLPPAVQAGLGLEAVLLEGIELGLLAPALVVEIAAASPDRNGRRAILAGARRNPLYQAACLVLRQAASCPTASRAGVEAIQDPFELEMLVSLFGSLGRLAAARNPHTPARLLTAWAGDEDPQLLRAIAGNPATPTGTLKWLARSPLLPVRLAVAGNASTLPETLGWLAGDVSPRVRARARRHLQFPAEAPRGSDSEMQQRTRWATAAHPATSQTTLEVLAGAWEAFVRGAVAENPTTPVELLVAMLRQRERDPAVLTRVLKRPELPGDALRQLAEHPRWVVRRALARHPAADVDLLRVLAADSDSRVRRAVLHRSDLTPELEDRIRHTALRDAVQCLDPARVELALRHLTGIERDLELNSRSPRWRYRLAVASNPAVPTAALALLATDGNRCVRTTARTQLMARKTKTGPPARG